LSFYLNGTYIRRQFKEFYNSLQQKEKERPQPEVSPPSSPRESNNGSIYE
jgi:hypothetical protein